MTTLARADGKHNDAAILNKHLPKTENCILKWSDKSDILVLYKGFRDSTDINKNFFG